MTGDRWHTQGMGNTSGIGHDHLEFTVALHQAAADPSANTCWSPFSVASAVGLVTSGARGLTRDELLTALLGDKSADLAALGAALTKAGQLAWDERRGEHEPVVAVSNTLWADTSIEILESFTTELDRWSSGSVRQAPFGTAPEQARELINSEVARTTRDLIPELLPSGAVRRETRAALVNALYLKCAWRYRFDHGTVLRPFHTPAGAVDVPTMALVETVGYAHLDGWRVVGLPAVGGVDVVVLLPDGDLGEAERSLDGGALAGLLAAPRSTEVALRLPRLRLSTGFELTSALRRLGVRTVFTDDADLGGISPSQLAVESVFHEAVLTVDESGFEGAAATAVMMRLTSASTSEPVPVVVDRPFLLVVRHAETGVVYFTARVVDPS